MLYFYIALYERTRQTLVMEAACPLSVGKVLVKFSYIFCNKTRFYHGLVYNATTMYVCSTMYYVLCKNCRLA